MARHVNEMYRLKLNIKPRHIKSMRNAILTSTVAMLACLAGAVVAATDDKPIGVVLAAGDITGCSPDEMQRAAQTATLLSQEIEKLQASQTPVKVIILGDLAYDSGTIDQFDCFQKTWGTVLASKLARPNADILPVPGNHEYRTESAPAFFETWRTNDWISQNPSGYYSLSFPEGSADAWRIFALNSEIENNTESKQSHWLSDALTKSKERCILGFWHTPVFSSGTHGHETSETEAPIKQHSMAGLEALLAKHDTSLVLNGHDHNYEQLAPHDQNGMPTPDGIRSFIVGTGGRSLRELEGTRWESISEVFDSDHHGILRLQLFPNRYAWNFLATASAHAAAYSGEANCNTRQDVTQ
jgi:acid phosphatase type 7